MSDIGKKIRDRRESLNMTQEQLAEKLGYKSRSSINKIESSGRNLPQSKIVAIAKALRTSPSYLMGWDDEKITSKDLERVEPNAYRKIINVYSRIPAGDPKAIEQYVEGFEVTDDYRVDYALKVHGDSMINAGIFNGSIVYVQKDADYNNGDIVIAVVNEFNATIKRYYRYGDKIVLKPENPSMKEKEYDAWDVELRGKVLSAKVFF